MLPFQFPPDAPSGLILYAIWASVATGTFIIIQNLRDPQNHLLQNANEDTDWKLSKLNTYLVNIVGNPEFARPLNSSENLMQLYDTIRRTGKSILKHRRLRRHVTHGRIASSIAFLVAIVCGGLYWVGYPTQEVAKNIGIFCVIPLGAWVAWHVAHLIVYNFQLNRLNNDD